MKKTTIFFGLIALMATFAIAINIGDTYTQQQIDSTDFSTINLNPSFGNYYVNKGGAIIRPFTYNAILQRYNQDTQETYYEAVPNNDKLVLGYYTDYAYCKTIRTVEECNTYIRVMADIKFNKHYNNIRDRYNNYKTQEDVEFNI